MLRPIAQHTAMSAPLGDRIRDRFPMCEPSPKPAVAVILRLSAEAAEHEPRLVPWLVRSALELEVRGLILQHCGWTRPAITLPAAIGVLRSSVTIDKETFTQLLGLMHAIELAMQMPPAARDFRWLHDRAVFALLGKGGAE